MRIGAFLALVAGAAGFGGQATAAECHLAKMAELPVTVTDLTPLVSAKINGQDTKLVADSGAFFSLLTPQTATRFHLKSVPAPFGFMLQGVNGATEAQIVTVDTFSVMGAAFRHTDFLVAGPQLNDEGDGLLGANFLTATDTEFDFANGMITLLHTTGDCGKSSLAYWAGDKPYSMMEISALSRQSDWVRGEVRVNGVAVRAIFDTGTPLSMLSRGAARAAGLKLDGPGVRSGGPAGGLGHRIYQTWIVPVASFKVGDEEVKNTELRVADIDLGIEDSGMLVGADFFLSHRVLVAKSQSKLYFSYNGGPVFRLDDTQSAAPTAVTQGAAVASDEPKDADGYHRRAAAFASRREYDNAIADYTHAVSLAPNDADLLIDRADVYWRKDDKDGALADVTAALKLQPGNVKALVWRGVLKLAKGDDAGAGADFDLALKADPAQWTAIADAYVVANEFPEGIARFDAWIAANPKSDEMAAALNGRCWARGLWGKDLDKAEADCDAALRLAPGAADILDSRGLVRLRREEFDKSISDYNAALRDLPDNAWSLYGRGVAELRKGLKDKGQADLAAAARADPKLADHARKLGIAP